MVHLICFRLEIPFFGKLVPKIKSCQFKLKLGTETISSMQNSMGMFTFFGFDFKYIIQHICSKNWQIVRSE